MAKKPDYGVTNERGLRFYVERAPAAVMREFASAALWRGHTLGSIARRISKKSSTVDTSNVRRYFESKAPRVDTIELLRSVIGLKVRHVKLVTGEALNDREYEQIEASLHAALARHETAFTVGAADEALSVFGQLDKDDQRSILRAFGLELERHRALMFDLNNPLPEPHLRFATALRESAGFDLLGQKRLPMAGEETLWLLWEYLVMPFGAFTESEAEAIVFHASALLRARNVNTQPMEELLRRERLSSKKTAAAAKTLKKEKA